jgi:hypothetical protein
MLLMLLFSKSEVVEIFEKYATVKQYGSPEYSKFENVY